jgi:hypothetical protein
MPEGDRKRSFKAGLVAGASSGLLIVLVASLWIGLINQQRYREEAANNTRQYAEYSKQKARESCVGVPAAQLPHCLAKAGIESKIERSDYQHNEVDLIAQRQAALWTGVMGIAALVGVGFSIAGVVLVWSAFQEARRQAEAAEGSLEVQREAVALQLRPYVMFFDDDSDDAAEKPFTNKSAFPVSFKNFGQTPAYSVMLRHGFNIRRKPVGFAEVALHRTEREDFGPLGPGADKGVRMFLDSIKPGDLAKVRSGAHVILFRFRVEYSLKSGETDFDDMTLVFDKEAWLEGGPRRITGQYRREKKHRGDHLTARPFGALPTA